MKRVVLSCCCCWRLPASPQIFYVSAVTAGTSKGIYAWSFDSSNGKLDSLGLMAEAKQPAHLWIAPNGKTLYSVNWEDQGSVSAYRIDPKTGALTFLNKASSHGAQPNQVVVDSTGNVAVTVNYTSGSLAAYALEPDGKLGEAFTSTSIPASPCQAAGPQTARYPVQQGQQVHVYRRTWGSTGFTATTSTPRQRRSRPARRPM
jgi:6-phosphogluconolactonase